ncbi:PD-(D/E)XK motif protein [Sphingomonas humi]|uniref:PD-(D/E)XK motif protein n=1 Tax=Sphingomonas humi TaxID=335630 RepID=A0ABP7RY39_9SPHN
MAVLDVPDGGADRGMLLAIDGSGDLHLLIRLTAPASAEDPPDLNGIRVRRRLIDESSFLDLIAPASNERVFSGMCSEVIEAVAVRGREPAAATAAIVRKWQAALRNSKTMMEQRAQVGLVGELYVLKQLMLPLLGPSAIDQWSGPHFERHDFVSGDVHIEVKSTRKSKHEHEISRGDQLNAPDGKSLLLVSVQLESTIAGNITLATLIDEILAEIQDDFTAQAEFIDKVERVGWSDMLRPSPELMRFFVRAIAVFEVDDEFPRLPDELELPSGIISVRYTVSLANLPSLGQDEVMERIVAANAP